MKNNKSRQENVPFFLLPPREEIEKELRKGFLKRILYFFNIHNVALLLLLVSLAVGTFGYLLENGIMFDLMTLNSDFYANISTELLSISITVLVIERLIRKREETELKRQLVRELKSNDNATALRALEELNAHDWSRHGAIRRAHLLRANFKNGYLKNVDLSYTWMRDANFENAYMQGTKLRGAVLVGVNLKGAKALTSIQLSEAKMLLAATMPNGKRYDGRFNLEGDIIVATSKKYDMSDPESAAQFYGVSRNTYLKGQKMKNVEVVELEDDIYIQDDWTDKYLRNRVV